MSKNAFLHYRRCHVCGAVNESEGAYVERCRSCEKPLCRFYYFDDSEAPIYSDREPDGDEPSIFSSREPLLTPSRGRQGDAPAPAKRILRGFTAIW